MPHPVTPTRRGRPLTLAALLAMLLAVGGAVTACAVAQAPAAVDGVRFSDAELEVASVRAERGGADVDDPSGRFDTLRDDLALFAVARSVGASDVTRPDDILDVVDDVNAQRAETAAAGGVLYGPVTYDSASFYGKSLTDIRQATLTRIEEGATGAHVTDDEVRARFDADRAEWADAATTYHVTRVTVPTAADGGPDPVVAAAVERGDVAPAFGGSTPESLDITSDQLATNVFGPDATAALLSAADGSVLGPLPEQGGWVAYRLDGRSVDAEAAFAHYASRIRSVLYAERLDALIADARDAQVVVGP
jgi:hypothetical protein